MLTFEVLGRLFWDWFCAAFPSAFPSRVVGRASQVSSQASVLLGLHLRFAQHHLIVKKWTGELPEREICTIYAERVNVTQRMCVCVLKMEAQKMGSNRRLGFYSNLKRFCRMIGPFFHMT
jgi:hypothetical protein